MANELSIRFKPNDGVQAQAFNFLVRFLTFFFNTVFDDSNPAPVIKINLSGGLGSGKTFTGSFFLIIAILWIRKKYPDEPVYDFMVVAPTYDLAIRVCCKTLRGNLIIQGFRPGKDFRYKKNEKLVEINGGINIRFISADNPENIAGDNVIGIWGDEIHLMKVEALRRMFARVRYGGRRIVKFMFLTGTPEVGNDDVEDQISDFKTFLLPTIENIKFVGDDYVRTLKRSFTREEQLCYLYGAFVRILSDLVFYSFKKDRNVISETIAEKYGYERIDPKLDLYVGMDFNVNPFVSSCFQKKRVPHLENPTDKSDYREAFVLMHVIELKNLMIDDMIFAIEEYYHVKGGGKGKIIVTPDSNKGRDTGSAYSPFSGLALEYEKMRDRPGWEIHIETRNPRILLSASTLNTQFERENFLFIDNMSCRKTISVFNGFKWINGVKFDETTKHYTDTVRYLCWFLYNKVYGRNKNIRT